MTLKQVSNTRGADLSAQLAARLGSAARGSEPSPRHEAGCQIEYPLNFTGGL